LIEAIHARAEVAISAITIAFGTLSTVSEQQYMQIDIKF
jgi:hypothetical protein